MQNQQAFKINDETLNGFINNVEIMDIYADYKIICKIDMILKKSYQPFYDYYIISHKPFKCRKLPKKYEKCINDIYKTLDKEMIDKYDELAIKYKNHVINNNILYYIDIGENRLKNVDFYDIVFDKMTSESLKTILEYIIYYKMNNKNIETHVL